MSEVKTPWDEEIALRKETGSDAVEPIGFELLIGKAQGYRYGHAAALASEQVQRLVEAARDCYETLWGEEVSSCVCPGCRANERALSEALAPFEGK